MVLAATALNMVLDDRTPVVTGRSPFDLLAHGGGVRNGRSERI
jgi:hypothetical protein